MTEEDLKIFEKGLFESHVVVFFYYSGKFLCQLSYIHKTVQDLFIRLSTHKSSKVRLNIMTSMLCKPCKSVLDYVLEKGLNDKSSTVRIKAADVISRLDLKEYADILPTYIQKEEKVKVKEELEFCLYWLTHDYKIEEKTKHGYSILVKTESGLTGVTINEEQFKNLDMTVEKIKNGTFEYPSSSKNKK